MARNDYRYSLRPVYLGVGILILFFLAFQVAPAIIRAREPSPITYGNVPFPVVHPVRAGEDIPLMVQRCNTSGEDLEVEFTRSLVPVEQRSKPIALGYGRVMVLDGCTDGLAYTSAVPLGTPPGKYQIVGIITVDGQWREHKVPYRTEPFEVIP